MPPDNVCGGAEKLETQMFVFPAEPLGAQELDDLKM